MTSGFATAPVENLLRGSGITLRVVSSDAALLTTCQEVLRSLEESEPPSEVQSAQVCLWDFQPGQNALPLESNPNEMVFYVVPPAHLEKLRSLLPDAEGNILLKPVTRLVLRAFLASVAPFRNPGSYIQQELGTLKADRDEILQHLLYANLRLQEYDQQRTNFIARAVHDFRAPLTALSGFCGLLAEGELGPLSQVQQEAINRMRRSIKRISTMASAMFDLSTGPRLSRKPDLREADILESVQQALHEITPMARDKRVQLVSDRLTPPPRPLFFEPSQIEQVLVNLLDNACKFVPKEGRIEVRAYPCFWERRKLLARIPKERRRRRTLAPNCYRVDVMDSGPAIASHLLESIFEEYTSYSGPSDRSGGGLGLAICRLIVSRHGGHVWAESSDSGNSFSFILPLRSAENKDFVLNGLSDADGQPVGLRH